MPEPRAGGFEYQGRAYRFEEALCSWSEGFLYIDAQGRRCGLRLVGVPFPGILEIADLAGHVWEPDEDELSRHADTFAEGSLEVRDKDLWIMSGRVACRRFDAERSILTVNFLLHVQDGEYGGEDEADGVAYCRVVPHDQIVHFPGPQRPTDLT